MKAISCEYLFTLLGKELSTERLGKKCATVAKFERGWVLVSFGTIVAAGYDRHLYLSNWHDYSICTNKHVRTFCGLGVAERRRRLADGLATRIESVGFGKAKHYIKGKIYNDNNK